jgi:trk system potassium uptake protein TrkA
MRILIVGAGAVGFHLARRLSEEGEDVVVVESDPDRSSMVADQLDVMVVTGNGASMPVLEKAGIEGTDLLLAVTSRDEVNLIACLAASHLDVGFRVARISNPEYYTEEHALSREQLGVNLMINPERECAWETFQLLNSEAATDLARFADGRLQLVGLRVLEGAAVAGKSLQELDRELKGRSYVTVAIVRDGETTIPGGRDRIEVGDQIYVLSLAEEMAAIPPLAGYEEFKLRRVMIAGGSREAVHLARLLDEHDVACTILDADRDRCAELAEALPEALVLHGDATDLELLEMEGVEGIDGFVAFTGQDETNMLSCLLAKDAGARKVIGLIDRVEYVPLVSRVGVDAAVSPRMSTVNAILRYVRRGNVRSVATLKGIDAEAMEMVVGPDAPAAGHELRELDVPEHGLFGAIIRGDRVITPRGSDVIRAGDRVIVFAFPDAVDEFERMLA